MTVASPLALIRSDAQNGLAAGRSPMVKDANVVVSWENQLQPLTTELAFM
eukprot:CAMPEP_0177341290 /NCGR_PEP_ID=MMETSP0368-20130122/26423_1 /TAXON_ID=447022 ORGANISM="Scrippsiella hangoei-like, Strain SHHI-4" /NCGR_SAMPLE_ID=MMETSP0368 /ASSEMBLY_ACC=CAM_ASM_000363 /LENGTH=49 /DNA_ID=CAMNT_0018802565 /DNA_START=363 /DNA_END=512 /DNA_ORIENTATION=-